MILLSGGILQNVQVLQTNGKPSFGHYQYSVRDGFNYILEIFQATYRMIYEEPLGLYVLKYVID